DLDQHPHARAGVDVGLDRPLGRRSLAKVLDLLALLQAQDLDRLLHIALCLREGFLAVHHARARALAKRLDLLGADLHRAHRLLAFPAGSRAGLAFSSACSPSAGVAGVVSPSAAAASAAGAAAASAAAGCPDVASPAPEPSVSIASGVGCCVGSAAAGGFGSALAGGGGSALAAGWGSGAAAA